MPPLVQQKLRTLSQDFAKMALESSQSQSSDKVLRALEVTPVSGQADDGKNHSVAKTENISWNEQKCFPCLNKSNARPISF